MLRGLFEFEYFFDLYFYDDGGFIDWVDMIFLGENNVYFDIDLFNCELFFEVLLEINVCVLIGLFLDMVGDIFDGYEDDNYFIVFVFKMLDFGCLIIMDDE